MYGARILTPVCSAQRFPRHWVVVRATLWNKKLFEIEVHWWRVDRDFASEKWEAWQLEVFRWPEETAEVEKANCEENEVWGPDRSEWGQSVDVDAVVWDAKSYEESQEVRLRPNEVHFHQFSPKNRGPVCFRHFQQSTDECWELEQ